jgi:F-type H+-transporting ATPase subunit alpha
MEAAIARGRLMREVLKQDRLSPVSAQFQLAWLMAFNEHLLDGLEPERLRVALQALETATASTALTLDSPPEDWRRAIADWLAAAGLRQGGEQPGDGVQAGDGVQPAGGARPQ